MSRMRHQRAAVQLPEDVERLVEWTVRFEAPVRPSPCIVEGCIEHDCRQTPEGVMCLEHWLEAPDCSECGEPGTVIRVRKNGVNRKVVLCRSCYCGEYSQQYLDDMEGFYAHTKSPPLF